MKMSKFFSTLIFLVLIGASTALRCHIGELTSAVIIDGFTQCMHGKINEAGRERLYFAGWDRRFKHADGDCVNLTIKTSELRSEKARMCFCSEDECNAPVL